MTGGQGHVAGRGTVGKGRGGQERQAEKGDEGTGKTRCISHGTPCETWARGHQGKGDAGLATMVGAGRCRKSDNGLPGGDGWVTVGRTPATGDVDQTDRAGPGRA